MIILSNHSKECLFSLLHQWHSQSKSLQFKCIIISKGKWKDRAIKGENEGETGGDAEASKREDKVVTQSIYEANELKEMIRREREIECEMWKRGSSQLRRNRGLWKFSSHHGITFMTTSTSRNNQSHVHLFLQRQLLWTYISYRETPSSPRLNHINTTETNARFLGTFESYFSPLSGQAYLVFFWDRQYQVTQ